MMRIYLLTILCILFLSPVIAQEAEPKPALDMREVITRIPVTITDVSGRTETKPMVMTIFRPRGEGRFPLLIFNHGRAGGMEARLAQARPRYEMQARYFTSRGFVVIFPFRLGYGDTARDFDPENTGLCGKGAIEPLADVMVKQVLAARNYARTLPYVDASRWVVAGQSYGGFAVLATLKAQPEGLVGAINFAGGVGGNVEKSPERPCGDGRKMADYLASGTGSISIPNLWFYWRNDNYWGAKFPVQWFIRWKNASHQGTFHHFPAIPTGDGHSGVSLAMDDWVPQADAFFDQLGFPPSPTRPSWGQSSVAVENVAVVPISQRLKDQFYKKFLEAKTPRAFAISPTGAVGWASGDWASGKALGYCERLNGEICTLYAVDNRVVWPKK
jgi:dienelactone hydrolase